jgi:hypothetical protein
MTFIIFLDDVNVDIPLLSKVVHREFREYSFRSNNMDGHEISRRVFPPQCETLFTELRSNKVVRII